MEMSFSVAIWGVNAFFCLILLSLAVYVIRVIYGAIHYYTGAYYHCTKRRRGKIRRSDGSKCEIDTYEALRKHEANGYQFLFNAYLPKADGTTSEIDCIAIGPNGIVVIENKDYSGEVIGLEYDKYWSQERPHAYERNESERWFYNPIMQNAGHIRALRNVVGNNIPVYSLIVFSDRCDLRVPKLYQNNVCVSQVKNAEKMFIKLTSASLGALSNEDVKILYDRLKKYTNVNRKIKRQHIKNCKAAATN